jgi:hypothetical protein
MFATAFGAKDQTAKNKNTAWGDAFSVYEDRIFPFRLQRAWLMAICSMRSE